MSDVQTRPPVPPQQKNGTPKADSTESPRRCGPRINTANRLFGAPEPVKRAVKVNETFRSSIFDTAKPSPPPTPTKKAVPVLQRNPITGECKVPAKVQV